MREWKDCRNLLLVRLDNMGDVIMSSAAISEIKRQMPVCKLTLLTSSVAAPIVPYLGLVDESILFDAPWVGIQEGTQEQNLLNLLERLRDKQFDGCIIFNVYSQSSLAPALLVYLAGVPLRGAYSRENPYSLLSHWLPDPEPFDQMNHQIYRDLVLLEIMGIEPNFSALPQLTTVPRTEVKDSETIAEVGLDFSYVLVNMDVSEVKRQFDARTIKQVVSSLLARSERVVFTGAEPSEHLNDCVSDIQNPDLINVVGRTQIHELLSLVQHARAVISVNTGLAHIACAYDRPILVLYAKTNPQHVPWSENADYIMYEIDDRLKSRNQIIRYVDQMTESTFEPLPSASTILERLDQLIDRESLSYNKG